MEDLLYCDRKIDFRMFEISAMLKSERQDQVIVDVAVMDNERVDGS